MDYTPISNPPGWSAEQDIESFEDRFGEQEDYSEAALELVSEAYEEFLALLDDTLVFFERRNPRLRPVHPGTLIAQEKIKRLTAAVEQGEPNYQIKQRIVENLAGCSWADGERARILESYYASEDGFWLHCLGEVHDALGCAVFEFRETMKIHYAGFEH